MVEERSWVVFSISSAVKTLLCTSESTSTQGCMSQWCKCLPWHVITHNMCTIVYSMPKWSFVEDKIINKCVSLTWFTWRHFFFICLDHVWSDSTSCGSAESHQTSCHVSLSLISMFLILKWNVVSHLVLQSFVAILAPWTFKSHFCCNVCTCIFLKLYFAYISSNEPFWEMVRR